MGCEASEKPKPRHRKGLWSPEEDERLRNYIINYGHGCWSSVPLRAGLQRNGKSCRLRWINYLRPGLKRGMFNQEEEAVILSLHHKLGNKWSQIAQHLPGRTDNEIKNFWHSYLKKKVAKAEELDNHYQTLSTSSSDHTTSSSSSLQTPTFPPFQCSKKPEIAFENPTPSFHNDFSKERSTFPKFFFAEWLPQDHLHFSEEAAHGFDQNSEAANGFDQNLNSDQAFIHGGGFSKEAAALESELYEQISNPQTEILSPQFILEDQFQSGLLNLEFQLNNDLIYI